MQRWEYCSLGDEPALRTCKLIYWKPEGPDIRPFGYSLENLSIAIGKLGEQGWEMVGCGNTDEGSHRLYFKRPNE